VRAAHPEQERKQAASPELPALKHEAATAESCVALVKAAAAAAAAAAAVVHDECKHQQELLPAQ
jgi:hypothetical protein